MLESDPAANYEYLVQQVVNTVNSIGKLLYSNNEMMKQDPNDPIYVEAVAENTAIIARQQAFVQETKKKLVELELLLGLPHKEIKDAETFQFQVVEDKSENIQVQDTVYL